MIYVDSIQHYPDCGLPYKYWCHMATDGDLSELHAMARRLSLKQSWFQDKPVTPHYDLTPTKRALAIRYGAQAVSTIGLARRCFCHADYHARERSKHVDEQAKGKERMNTNLLATVELHEQAPFSDLADLIQELETQLADLPELERRRLMDRAIRMRQAEMRRLADAARREVLMEGERRSATPL